MLGGAREEKENVGGFRRWRRWERRGEKRERREGEKRVSERRRKKNKQKHSPFERVDPESVVVKLPVPNSDSGSRKLTPPLIQRSALRLDLNDDVLVRLAGGLLEVPGEPVGGVGVEHVGEEEEGCDVGWGSRGRGACPGRELRPPGWEGLGGVVAEGSWLSQKP
jgi:hypothetical protein